MTVTDATRLAWRGAPWGLAVVLGLLLWCRPVTPGPHSPGGAVIVAGKAALTPPAKHWEATTTVCPPAAAGGQGFRVVTREPSEAELERLAQRYAARFQPSGQVTAPVSSPEGGKQPQEAPAASGRPFSRVFGEYSAPRMRYGGTYLSGLDDTGELQEVFDPAGAPRFGWVGSWGLGGFYDLSSNQSGSGLSPDRGHRFYAFLEPLQTKLVYWRIEGGARSGPDGWKPYIGLGAEFRTDGWHLGRVHGLRPVKAQ